MLWCTRLHVYISTSLCTCAVDASPANDNDVIDNDGCGVTGVFLCGKIHLKRCWHFCTFLHNPYFDFEPDYAIRKPRKWGFQRYIVRTERFSTFHARVEYISVKTVIGQIDLPTPRAAMTPMTQQSIYRLHTDRIKHHNISPAVHSVHLADIINKWLTIITVIAFDIWQSELDTADIVLCSKVNCPPRNSLLSQSARICSRVTIVISQVCRSPCPITDLNRWLAVWQAVACKMCIDNLFICCSHYEVGLCKTITEYTT